MEHTMLQLAADGYALLHSIYTTKETEAIIETIEHADTRPDTFRKAPALFAIRRLLYELPVLKDLLFTPALLHIIETVGQGYFVSKAIYFNKPADANWPVAMHRDLTIAVTDKHEVVDYGPWSVKPGQFAVQPPLGLLRDNFTIRIHLDDTTAENGALNVVPGSHMEDASANYIPDGNRVCCAVSRGGVMLMRPMLLHASARTTNGKPRRVVHLEFSRATLPAPLQWAEQLLLPKLVTL